MRRVVSEIVRLGEGEDGMVRRLGWMVVAGFVLCLLGMALVSSQSEALARSDALLGLSAQALANPGSTGDAAPVQAAEAPPLVSAATGDTSGGDPGTYAADAGPSPGSANTTNDLPTIDVDVVVYATQTSGLAAVRELALGAPQLRVALISCGNLLETPLTQGLSVEDVRNAGHVTGGFYGEWRQTVTRYYSLYGMKAANGTGRFTYEPEVAAKILWSYVSGSTLPNVQFYSAKLLGASDRADARYVDISAEGIGELRLNTKYFIDASVEADLARMLGADYRIGRAEDVYNDVLGNRPAYPSSENGWVTAPQRFSALLTLQVHSSGRAPRIADLWHPNYDPASFAGTTFAWKNVSAFANSWTMKIAVLPKNKRELNETWSDHPDIGLAFQWIFEPDRRGDIRKQVLQWTINRARYLQENGYARVGVATIPQKLYVREGPRVVGLDTYTADDLRSVALRQPVAVGCYCEYDRHDAFYPTHIETTRYVYMPMEALMAAGHPALLVSTAVSTDSASYCSAVRMEHCRANMGAAAAMMVITAAELGVELNEVPYETVRSRLIGRGYQIPLS
ncbi:MAG: FAD-dependent oxidoreductase [Thermoleophilia bacterium]|nr:FAD-dependent oxidoreductase [Thermoleophilia bacterium]